MESVGSLIDELAGTRVKRTLRCDNAAATAMANGGPGSWRTRHLRVRSAHLIEKISRGEMSLSHIEGQNQLADLGTKMHPKVRLWQLLRLWGFEQLLPEATVALVVRVCFLAGMMTMIENVPGATAMDGEDDQEKPPISRTGTDELLLLCTLVCIVAIALWEAVKWLVRNIMDAPAALRRERKLQKLRERAREAAEEEVQRAYEETSPGASTSRQPASASSSTCTLEARSPVGMQEPRPAWTPRVKRETAQLPSEGQTVQQTPERRTEGEDDSLLRDRVTFDMLMLFRVEGLKAGLREEGLHLSGLKEDLARRLATRLTGPLDREPTSLPSVRQMKYVLWLWRNRSLAGRCLVVLG